MIKARHFICIALLIALGACGGGGTDSGGIDTTIQPVVAIGDSIGTGFGVATPWPPRLEGLIGRSVVNNSRNNEQTAFGLANIESLINANDPSHVFILLGTNDAIRGSVGNAISNLQQMVDIARANNVVPIVGTLPPITDPTIPSANARAEDISQGIRGLNGAVVAEVRGAMGDGSTTLDEDGIHPNNQGQQIIAEAFASVFP